MTTTELVENSIVAGRYRLERLLGEGGMGSVWAARELRTDERVAVKLLKGYATLSKELHKRFLREARAAMAVKHDNVVRIHEVVHDDAGAPVMVMDLLVGESLGERLERVGKLELHAFAKIYAQVLSAVGSAHALGIIHRDLKPDNVFLEKRGPGADAEPDHVRVLDFGIAKLTASEGEAVETAGLTGTGSMLGTPYYMSPEQVFGEKDLDHRADIWSLGVILYECLSGKKPVAGENMGQILKVITSATIAPLADVAPHVPADVAELATRMLSLDRGARPKDLREVAAVIKRYASIDVADFAAATQPAMPSDLPPRPPARASDEALSPSATVSPVSTAGASAPLVVERRGARSALLALGAVGAIVAGAWLVLNPSRDDAKESTTAPVTSTASTPSTTDAQVAADDVAPLAVVSASALAPVPAAKDAAAPLVAPSPIAKPAPASNPSAAASSGASSAKPSASASGLAPGGIAHEVPY